MKFQIGAFTISFTNIDLMEKRFAVEVKTHAKGKDITLVIASSPREYEELSIQLSVVDGIPF